MIILIVGPSGVGKSRSCEESKTRLNDVVFDQLDGLAPRWAVKEGIIDHECVTLLRQTVNSDERFLEIGLQAIGDLEQENPGKHLVIDVGAGFQTSPTATERLRHFHILLINADVEVAHERIVKSRSDSRTLQQYRHQEFASNRIAVYKLAQHTVDSTRQSEVETADALIAILRMVFEEPS